MYRINQIVEPHGWGQLHKCVFFHKDINEVKQKLCELVKKGTPVEELSISKDVEFDFKCAVALRTEDNT